jgi:hypothetical protein
MGLRYGYYYGQPIWIREGFISIMPVFLKFRTDKIDKMETYRFD